MIRLPLVLIVAVLGGLALCAAYEWFGLFTAGLLLALALAVWFEIHLSKIANHLDDLDESLALDLLRLSDAVERLNEGRCGALAPMAYPGTPGTTACELTHGHRSEWHRGAARPGGLPGMEWRDRPDLAEGADLPAGTRIWERKP